MRNADERDTLECAIGGNMDGHDDDGRAAHHVLHRREGQTLAAQLLLGRGDVRVGVEVGAGVHHHAELGEQQRQRQHMHEPTAIASNQNSPFLRPMATL